MSLYGDLPPPSSSGADPTPVVAASSDKSKPKPSGAAPSGPEASKDKKKSGPGWGARSTIMMPVLKRRPPTVVPNQHKSAVLRVAEKTATANRTSKANEVMSSPPEMAPAKPTIVIVDPQKIFFDVTEHYDPLRPNDYESYSEKKAKRRKMEDSGRQTWANEEYGDPNLQGGHQGGGGGGMGGGASTIHADVATNNRSISGEEAFKRRALLSANTAGPAFAPAPVQGLGYPSQGLGFDMGSAGKSESIADKMMKNMGYVEGQGLGRKEDQGQSGPPCFVQSSERRANTAAANPRVVLLKNMVGPNDRVDDGLEPEIRVECSKYGEVDRVTVFEDGRPGYGRNRMQLDPAGVLIYVQFRRADAAARAVRDLDGRYFGGQKIQASFFSDEAFQAGNLSSF